MDIKINGAIVCRRTATLAATTWHTVNYTALCFINSSVHLNVLNVYAQVLQKPTGIWFSVIFVLEKSSNFINGSTLTDASECISI
jgi:hypothetical protein